jgi:asparagine synthase (glutamine-hydrolysing)
MTQSTWYDILNHIPSSTVPFDDEDLFQLDELFTNIFSDYIPDEVDYALNISGGVDSTLLAAKCHDVTGELPLLQNQDYEGEWSERPWINELANVYNAQVDYHLVTPELILNDYLEAFSYQAQPFGGVTVIGYTPLYKNALLKKIKVVLDGTGLDEIFLGYPRYYTNYESNNSYWISSQKGASGPTDKRGIRPQAISPALYNSSCIISNDAIKRFEPLQYEDTARYLAFLDLFSFKIPRTLRFTDHASSRFSLELRSPFLSFKLIHHALRYSSNSFINNAGSKLPVREILRTRKLHKIANAPKRYVQSPQNVWIDKQLYCLLDPLLSPDALVYSLSILDPIIVRQQIHDYSFSPRSNSFYLWQWLSVELFLRKFFS